MTELTFDNTHTDTHMLHKEEGAVGAFFEFKFSYGPMCYEKLGYLSLLA